MKKRIFGVFLILFLMISALYAQSLWDSEVFYEGNKSNQEFLEIAGNSNQLRAEFLQGLRSVNSNANIETWFLIYPNDRDAEDNSVITDVVNNSMPRGARVGEVYLVLVNRGVRQGPGGDGWIIYLRHTGNNVWDNIMYYYNFSL